MKGCLADAHIMGHHDPLDGAISFMRRSKTCVHHHFQDISGAITSVAEFLVHIGMEVFEALFADAVHIGRPFVQQPSLT